MVVFLIVVEGEVVDGVYAHVSSSIRNLSSDDVSKQVKLPGIVVTASGIKSKASKISILCRSCRAVIPNIEVRPGFESYQVPRKCNVEQAGRPK